MKQITIPIHAADLNTFEEAARSYGYVDAAAYLGAIIRRELAAPHHPLDAIIIREVVREGRCDGDIAQRHGLTNRYVSDVRRRHHLKANPWYPFGARVAS
jgi:hypothetical protein